MPNTTDIFLRGRDDFPRDLAARNGPVGDPTDNDGVGSFQDDAYEAHTHPDDLAVTGDGTHEHGYTHGVGDHEGSGTGANSRNLTGATTTGGGAHVHGIGGGVQSSGTGVETRSVNIYVDWVVLADLALAGDSAGPFVVILDGAVDPTDDPGGTGNEGDFYVNNTTTTWFGPKTGGAWGTGVALIGPQGVKGDDGASGQGGLPYSFQDTVGIGDPGAGNVQFDNATVASVTQIVFSTTDSNAADVRALLNTWDDAVNPTGEKARLDVRIAVGGAYASFFIDGIFSDASTHVVFDVTFISEEPTIPDDTAVNVQQVTFGDQGDVGATGPTGPQGPTLAIIYDWTDTITTTPGAGDISSDSADPGSAPITELYVNETDKDAIDQSATLALLAASTNLTGKSIILLVDPALTSKKLELEVTALSSAGGVSTFTVIQTAVGGNWNAAFEIGFTTLGIVGDKGINGTGGDVFGPAAGVVDDEIALFGDTTGKLIKGSGGATLSDLMKLPDVVPVTDDNLSVFDGVGGGKLREIALTGTQAIADSSKLGGIDPGANLYIHPAHSGDVVSAGDGATTIQPSVVGTTELIDNSVTNDKLGPMAAFTVKAAQAAGDPLNVPLDASEFLGRAAAGNIDGLDANAAMAILALATNPPARLNTAQAFGAGQKKVITNLATWLSTWAVEDGNDFDIVASINAANNGQLLPVPSITTLANGEAQAGEITVTADGVNTVGFAALWTFPDATVLDLTEIGEYTMYYRVWKNSGGTAFYRITALRLWGG